MTLADEIKSLNDKIKTKQSQYNLDRVAAKISHCHLKNRTNINI